MISYGWGKGALGHAAELLGSTGLEVVGAMELNGHPTESDLEKIRLIGEG